MFTQPDIWSIRITKNNNVQTNLSRKQIESTDRDKENNVVKILMWRYNVFLRLSINKANNYILT